MYRIILDTEFTGAVQNYKTTRVYDLGFVIVDKDFNIVRSFNWVVREIFENDYLMGGSYYADKLPSYYEEIAAGVREVKRFADIQKDFAVICSEYKVKQVWAYNAAADMNALNGTTYMLSNGFCNKFLPNGVNWCDIWNFATHALCCSKKYYKFVADNNFLGANGRNCKTSAEIVYRYLIDDATFVEKHTGLEDAYIEAAILQACLKKKKKIYHEINSYSWRTPQRGFRDYQKSF